MEETVMTILGLGLIAIWIGLSLYNARSAFMVGKDPTAWGFLSFILFPLGTLIIFFYLNKKRRGGPGT
ncbi:MAG: hypothetical protein A2W25_03990 [candidate division Zixibacteria bacterium RBG_16_53_22]|nr:MAG: hypothetical protein A2W25_03990 [candidate division Zixibacteria bacterium RBG_16_53_22]